MAWGQLKWRRPVRCPFRSLDLAAQGQSRRGGSRLLLLNNACTIASASEEIIVDTFRKSNDARAPLALSAPHSEAVQTTPAPPGTSPSSPPDA